MVQYPALYGKKEGSLEDWADEDPMEEHAKNLEVDSKGSHLESKVKELPRTSSVETGIEQSNAKWMFVNK